MLAIINIKYMRYVICALCLTLSGCSLVQLLPSSSCQYVEYVRVDNVVNVKAVCNI
jgi:metal-sulfur cluster biosynthetic enzyme